MTKHEMLNHNRRVVKNATKRFMKSPKWVELNDEQIDVTHQFLQAVSRWERLSDDAKKAFHRMQVRRGSVPEDVTLAICNELIIFLSPMMDRAFDLMYRNVQAYGLKLTLEARRRG